MRVIRAMGKRRLVHCAALGAMLGAALAGGGRLVLHASAPADRDGLAPITVDYPAEGALFPPDMTAPTVLWRDAFQDGTGAATRWHIEVSFADGSAPIELESAGEAMRLGPIDPRCVSPTNELPRLTPEQAAAHTWKPDPATWAAIKQRSVEHAAAVTITGWRAERAVSRGRMSLRTSRDPVGAPIFYRDVPLMPSEGEKGVIQPLSAQAVRLIGWRLRDVGREESRVLIDSFPTCANCHSFSADGKTLGVDVDGPQNAKGLYALVNVQPQTTIRNQDVIEWSTFRGKLGGKFRVGFMSQVSPDGKNVVTMINDPGAESRERMGDVRNKYYATNFKDYRFLQVFYPTRGILAWYSRESEHLQPLAGADDPRYVQTGGVWSPDGQTIVFARAPAKDPFAEGQPPALRANDPNETQIRYDLYRVPFNGGRGGRAEPLAGASANGMSNSFPKISPDGRWLVYVQARNGLLMRPDSQLYIVPAGGGVARRMRCNTPLMNSWHSWSPNGRWLVFSSKSRSPYTQMFLTHVDENGNDTPAVLIENATAANRAVNIPEFVNIAPDGLLKIESPATEFYRLSDLARELGQQGRHDEAIQEWRRALALQPDDASAEANLGVALAKTHREREAATHLEKAIALNPHDALTHSNLGGVLAGLGDVDAAIAHFQKALEIAPNSASAHYNLGVALYTGRGDMTGALAQWRAALRLDPDSVPALTRTAWVLATSADAGVRSGVEAQRLARRAAQLSGAHNAEALDALAAAEAESGHFAEATLVARQAIEAAVKERDGQLAESIRRRIAFYETEKPFRERHPVPAPSDRPVSESGTVPDRP
jgi:tetratricopeptide (TPR) repeat protein